MRSSKTTDTRPAQSFVRRRALCVGSLLLTGGLALTGCATDVASTSAATSSSAASDSSSSTTADSTTNAETISSTAAAAEAFLATLSDEQREPVLYDFDDETKTTSWSNFPVTFVQRAGLNLPELTDEQKTAALEVLQALLSDEAYDTVSGIMGGDEYLHENSSTTEQSLGQYCIAFFGDPSDTSAFEVQFSGHHLGINATLDGATDAITFAPTHLGVQPAVYTDAFAFFDSLTVEQQATLTSGDVNMCAPGDTCDFTTGDGLTGADLTDEQKQLLLDLIANWSGMADEQTTADSRAKIKATLDDTVIAWSGETTYDMSTGGGISFSISGPDVYVAFQAQQGSAGADVEGVSTTGWGHVHTIYRDPTNDHANSVTQQAASGMGAPAGAPADGAAPGSTPSN